MISFDMMLDTWCEDIDINPNHKSRVVQPHKHIQIKFGGNGERVVEMQLTPTSTIVVTADGDVMKFGAMDDELLNMFEVSMVVFKGKHT